jgi:hypothetical protein
MMRQISAPQSNGNADDVRENENFD